MVRFRDGCRVRLHAKGRVRLMVHLTKSHQLFTLITTYLDTYEFRYRKQFTQIIIA